MISLQDLENGLSNPQKKIIQEICRINLESCKRFLDGTQECEEDVKLFLIRNEVTEDEFLNQIKSDYKRYLDLHENPDDLNVLDDWEISNFRHYLVNLGEEYKKLYPNAVRNLWNRLHLIEDIRKQKFQACNLN